MQGAVTFGGCVEPQNLERVFLDSALECADFAF